MNRIALSSILIASAALAAAQPKTFKIVQDKLAYRNLATVESATEFETFTGRTTSVSGSLKFSPQARSGGGVIEVAAATLDTGIEARNGHLRSSTWLDTDKYPTIRFESTKVVYVSGDNYKVSGKLTLHGVTRPITANVRLRYRAEGADTQKVGFAGDVAQIYTRFDIKLADYGITIPAVAAGKVGTTVSVTLSAYATTK